jgi:hypothetical protein
VTGRSGTRRASDARLAGLTRLSSGVWRGGGSVTSAHVALAGAATGTDVTEPPRSCSQWATGRNKTVPSSRPSGQEGFRAMMYSYYKVTSSHHQPPATSRQPPCRVMTSSCHAVCRPMSFPVRAVCFVRA